MSENQTVIDEAIGNGLRPKRDMSRDQRYLHDMLNIIPMGPRRGRTLRQVTYPISGSPSLSMSWPFPQILRDEKIIKYFGATTIYDLVVSSYPFTATARDVFYAMQAVTNGRFETDTDWTKGTGWTIASGKATKATATTAQTLTQAGVFDGSSVYLITYTISGYTSGTLTVKAGTAAGTGRTANGTYTEEITSNGTGLTFSATGSDTTAFIGSIDNVSIIKKTGITSGTGWQMVGFQDRIFFATNNSEFIFRLPSNPLDASARDTYLSFGSALTVAAVGKHDNALVIGGMAGSQLSATVVTNLFSFWRDTQEQNLLTTEDDTLDDTYIMFFAPGGAANDQPYLTAIAALGFPGAYEAAIAQGVVYSDVVDGLTGFYRPKQCGSIKAVKQLGGDLLCYGLNGVCRLVRSAKGYTEVPLVDQEGNTVDQGIPSRTAVCGTDAAHYFVSNRGDLYRITAETCTRLDYSEFLETLTGSSIVATHDPVRGHYNFCDGTYGFSYTGHGLGKCDAVQPSSLLRLDASDLLLGTAITASDPQIARVVSCIVAAPDKQSRETSSIEFHCNEADSSSWKATADWRMRSSDQFRRDGTLVDVSDRGRCFVKKPGIEHRAYAEAENYKDVDLDMMVMSFGIGKPKVGAIFSGGDTILSETYV